MNTETTSNLSANSKKIEQNKQKKMEKALAVAQQLFLEDGFKKTSMDKVAKESKMTKQTLYRYYPSKQELFKQTVIEMGKSKKVDYNQFLEKEDTKHALKLFARAFIHYHLSKQHIDLFRLLITEYEQSEIIETYFLTEKDETQSLLRSFFIKRLNVSNPENLVQLFMGMLLCYRTDVALNRKTPTDKEIDQLSSDAVEMLLSHTAPKEEQSKKSGLFGFLR